MNEKTLRRPFEQVKDGIWMHYGGNQGWSEKKTMRAYGCGVIGAAHVILHEENRRKENLTVLEKAEFVEFVENLRRQYLPVLPHFGINGVMLSLGINRYFRKNNMALTSHWGIGKRKLWEKTAKMLAADIPVIIGVGPNYPLFWKKNGVTLYQKKGEQYVENGTVCGHYMIVTAMDEEWLLVSSWGKKYYINKAEYIAYIRKYSNSLFCNVLCVRRTAKR